MATISVDNMLFDLADASPSADAFANAWLNNKRFVRLRNQMAYWLNRQSSLPTPSEFQTELTRRAAEFVFDDEPDEDMLMSEAIEIASDVIRKKLSESGMPEPKGGLADHARQLIEADEAYMAQARLRLEARATASAESVQLLNMDSI
jgi:hypothetical protein